MVVMIFDALATAWLHGVIEPLIPGRDWRAFFSGLSVIVAWRSLTSSLRRFTSPSLVDLLSAFWW
jgi:hypothetical protein